MPDIKTNSLFDQSQYPTLQKVAEGGIILVQSSIINKDILVALSIILTITFRKSSWCYFTDQEFQQIVKEHYYNIKNILSGLNPALGMMQLMGQGVVGFCITDEIQGLYLIHEKLEKLLAFCQIETINSYCYSNILTLTP